MKQINLIHSFYPSLTRSEKKICDYLFENQEEFVSRSIQDLSEAIEVGEATIIRFCRKVGFAGFQDLKLALEKDREEDLQTGRSETYIDTVAHSLLQVVENTRSLVDAEVLERAVDILYRADHIVFLGVGSSGLAAKEAQASFLRLGVATSAYTDSHFQAMQACALTEKDAVVAISLTGSTSDTVFAAGAAKKAGSRLIVMTNYIRSPLAKLGDCVLLTGFKENLMEGGSLAAKVSQLCLLSMLRTGYYHRDPKRFNATKEKMARTVLSKISKND